MYKSAKLNKKWGFPWKQLWAWKWLNSSFFAYFYVKQMVMSNVSRHGPAAARTKSLLCRSQSRRTLLPSPNECTHHSYRANTFNYSPALSAHAAADRSPCLSKKNPASRRAASELISVGFEMLRRHFTLGKLRFQELQNKAVDYKHWYRSSWLN